MKKEELIVDTQNLKIPSETQPDKLVILGHEFDCSNIEEMVNIVKAFDILKRTGLDIDWFKSYFIEQDKDFEVYDKVRMEFLGKRYTLAPSEFELLKGILK